jgi:hypothetical protein
MNQSEKVDQAIKYLLGALSEPEQAAIEGEYSANPERFEEICTLENDLIDDYLRGDLPAAEREQFERGYLSSPKKLRRVQFARTMLSSLYGISGAARHRSVRGAPESPGFRTTLAAMKGRSRFGPSLALASVAIILMAAVVVIGLEYLRLRQRLSESEQRIASESQRLQDIERRLDDQTANSRELEKELDILRSQRAQDQTNSPGSKLSPIVAAFSLRLGLLRDGAEQQILAIAPAPDVIELRLNLKSVDFKKYSATLTTPEGTPVWKQAQVGVRPSQTGGRIALRVPARLLPAGDYILRVDGMNPAGESVELGDSYFRVARKQLADSPRSR